MLHILTQSPYSNDSLASCLRVVGADDMILLTEDAVLAATDRCLWEATHCHVCVLVPDLALRGLESSRLEGITAINFAGFVALTEQHHPIQSW